MFVTKIIKESSKLLLNLHNLICLEFRWFDRYIYNYRYMYNISK